jgi:hypothetical protein
MRAALAVAAVLLLAPGAALAGPAELDRAGAYLAGSLDRRGCAAEPGGTPSANLTAWVALGLVAAGRSAATAADCIEGRSGELRSATDLELAILALVAAGRDPRSAGGRDLALLLDRQLRGGRIGPTPASNQFGILALRALGRPVPAAVRATLMRDQNPDGSWPVAPGGEGDSNLTASGISAAIASGVPASDERIRRAVRALSRFRGAGGGYVLTRGARPDAQSTAWVIQGLAAAGRRDAGAEAHLRGLGRPDGSVSYQRGVAITPVWVTAQGAIGLARRSFPLVP